jgi:hypothetical protein
MPYDNILFLEQPTKVELGTKALTKTNVFLKERNSDACIIADESLYQDGNRPEL